jgi:hypothetical protein
MSLRQLFLSFAGRLTEFSQVHFEQLALYGVVNFFQLLRLEPPRSNFAPPAWS